MTRDDSERYFPINEECKCQQTNIQRTELLFHEEKKITNAEDNDNRSFQLP